MLWRRQSWTSQEPLASQGWRNCVRVITDHEPGPATPLTVRQVTPLNSHPAALLRQPMDIALTCHPAADYRVRQGGRCLRRIHSTGPHVITCPVTKPRTISEADVSAPTHVARSIRITLRYGGLLCCGAGSP